MSAAETFVVPDCHGNRRLVLGLLEQEGLVDYYSGGEPFRLRSEVQVVQLGDLCNCVRGSINDDLAALELLGSIIDRMLVGNHEHPYFGGLPFDGFAFYVELKEKFLKANDHGLIQAALAVDGILLTHAGITRDVDQVDKWHGGGGKAAEVAEALNTLWRANDHKHAMFQAVGRSRGGRGQYGGILWSDWRENKSELFPQIFGHTVGDTWRAELVTDGEPSFMLSLPQADTSLKRVRTLCLDIGAGRHSNQILGCWIRNGRVELVEYKDGIWPTRKPPRRGQVSTS